MPKARDESLYGDGYDDGLEPIQPLDLTQTRTIDQLLRAMGNTAFGGRRLGEGADLLEEMVRDADCFRVVTVSGAMTVAKQGLVLCEMIDRGWVQAIVSTGALMTHGLVEGTGGQHFKHRPSMRDEDLLVAYVLSAYLLEGRPDDVPRILRRIGAGEHPVRVFEDVMGFSVPVLEGRLRRWLDEVLETR